MRKRTTCCVFLVLFLFPFVSLFSQMTEVALLTSGNFSSILQQKFNVTPSNVPSPEALTISSFASASKEDCMNEPVATVAAAELMAMQTAISDFFGAMNSGKTDRLKESCTPDVAFKTHLQDQFGNHNIFEESINDLIPFVSKSGTCFNIDVQYELLPPDPSSMQFRAPYFFYINEQVSHCGVCTFELEKAGDVWKIKQMVDTRSRSCK